MGTEDVELSQKLKRVFYENGAGVVGVGDMHGVVNCEYPVGISVAIPLPRHLIRDLQTAPTKEYREVYYTMNQKLNEIVLCGETFLKERGFEAYAQTTDRIVVNEYQMSRIPHKTVATRAGIGWIGKNNLLVTRKFGSAVRLSSLLTSAPLVCDVPVERSFCGTCNLCVRECPAQALKGTLWEPGVSREQIVDIHACYIKQKEIMYAHTGIDTDLCGKCFAVCAHTKKYLKSDLVEK